MRQMESPYDAPKTSEESIVYFDDGSKLIISPVYATDAVASIKAAANPVTKFRYVSFEDSDCVFLHLDAAYTIHNSV